MLVTYKDCDKTRLLNTKNMRLQIFFVILYVNSSNTLKNHVFEHLIITY